MTGLLPKLASDIAEWFPMLDGRALAVSDAKITKDNLPTLPLVMVSLASGAPDQPVNLAQRSSFSNVDRFVIEFWLQSKRYIKADNGETPFWTYYDYESLRDTLFANLKGWRGPNGEAIYYVGFGVDATEWAVVITFNMQARFEWCIPNISPEPPDGEPIGSNIFRMHVCQPQYVYCPQPEEEEEVDPCLPSV